MKKRLLSLLLVPCLLWGGASVLAAETDGGAWKNAAVTGICPDGDGAVYVCDAWNKVVWHVSGGEAERFAGVIPAADLSGEPRGAYRDGSADEAYFMEPWDIVPFLYGYAVSDAGGNAVRYISGDRTVYTLAGSGQAGRADGAEGASVSFDRPTGLAVDEDGALYVADTGNGAIRRISTEGEVTNWAECMSDPTGICWSGGALYVAETGRGRILKLSPARSEAAADTPGGAGSVDEGAPDAPGGAEPPDTDAPDLPDPAETAAEDGSGPDGGPEVVAGLSGDAEPGDGYTDGPAASARFDHPSDVAVDDDGTVYVADTLNGAVRMVRDGRVYTLSTEAPSRPAALALADGGLTVGDAFSGGVSGLTVQDLSYADIPSGAWFETAAVETARRGLAPEPDSEDFGPFTTVTRAVFVSLIAGLARNADGAAVIDGDASYADIADDGWYAASARWAAEQGITEGMSGVFLPNLAITREQAAVMLLRYARNQGYSDYARAFLGDYEDADRIDAWALEAVSWAAGSGLMQDENGYLQPGAALTRAETAVLLLRFMDRYGL